VSKTMKKRIRIHRGILFFLAVGLTLVSGVIHGHLTGRWGPPSLMVDAGEDLQNIATDLGDWHMEDSSPISDEAIAQLQCAGYINRTYKNRHTGHVINVALLIGPAAPVSIHIPEICYSSTAYTIQDHRRRVNVCDEESKERFWALTFSSRDVHDDTLRVYYAWNDGSGWSAPDRPRYTFTARPFLYKMQLAAYVPPGGTEFDEDPCHRFLESFLPEVENHLMTPDSTNKQHNRVSCANTGREAPSS